MEQIAKKNIGLWLLTASPVIWAAHFSLCYGTVSVWCAKMAEPGSSLTTVRIAIAAYTAVALVAIGVIARVGHLGHNYGQADLPHDSDTPEDRHRFLGFATLLLSLLSGVAVVFAALVAVFFTSCN
jgi:hypothetical protein